MIDCVWCAYTQRTCCFSWMHLSSPMYLLSKHSTNLLPPTHHPKSIFHFPPHILSPLFPSSPSLSPLYSPSSTLTLLLYLAQTSSPFTKNFHFTLKELKKDICSSFPIKSHPMASSTIFTTPTIQKHISPSTHSFVGLRRIGTIQPKSISLAPARSVARRAVVRSELSPSLVISLSTGLSLFLGRFVFFNFQRENVAKQVPKQNGKSHFEAGDTRAQEVASLLKSNDPVGFNIVDVLAWGSIGHIVAYYILATSSNGYDPKFF